MNVQPRDYESVSIWNCSLADVKRLSRQPQSNRRCNPGQKHYACAGFMEVAFLHQLPGCPQCVRIRICHSCSHPPYHDVGLNAAQRAFVEAHMNETAARIYEMMLAHPETTDSTTHYLKRDSVYRYWLEIGAKRWRLDPNPKESVRKRFAMNPAIREVVFDEAVLPGVDVIGFVVLEVMEQAKALVRQLEDDPNAKIEEVAMDATCEYISNDSVPEVHSQIIDLM